MPSTDRAEIDRLREWKHQHVAEHFALVMRLQAVEAQLKSDDRRRLRERAGFRLLLDVIVAVCAIAAIALPHLHV